MRITRNELAAGLISGIAAALIVGCAELVSVPDAVESALDQLDAALIGLSVTYGAACNETKDRPEYCDGFRDSLNRAINARNKVVSE